MLNEIDLKEELTKEEIRNVIKPEIQALNEKISVLQQKIKEAKIPVMVVFEGWGASGKGSLIGKLIINLDPRGFQVYSTVQETEEEKRRPFMNRFWLNIPARGQIAVFDKSWYIDYEEEKRESIQTFERQLNDDNYLIVKFFLHITKKEQKKRMNDLLEEKETAWRVNEKDIWENKHYDKMLGQYDAMLEETSTEYAPWHVINSMNKHMALYQCLTILVNEMEKKLLAKKEIHKGVLPSQMKFPLVKMPKLKDVSLDYTMEEEEYKDKLDKLQKKLNKLSYKMYMLNIPLILCYEGWDAAGKGGNIKRVASSLDPRDYDVTPVSAPDSHEAARHYLWRFWKNIPKSGHTEIFDRTWYGRVMVERIEGFCKRDEWKRAYNEINEFEQELSNWGAVIVKFWLQVDQEEQLKRFTERQNTPEKQWKITEEDWRNREKWDKYEIAVNDMIRFTSTEYAPWHIIESNSKYYARIKTLETIIEAIEKRLKL